MNADRTLLTDSMWEALSPLLPGQAGKVGVSGRDTRGFVEAVLWLGRTGVGWRDLPPHLGQWHRVYVRFARWRDKGTWELATAWLIANNRQIPHSRQRQLQVDSTSVRVHQHGTGAEKKTGSKPSGAAGAGTRAKFIWSGTERVRCWAGSSQRGRPGTRRRRPGC